MASYDLGGVDDVQEGEAWPPGDHDGDRLVPEPGSEMEWEHVLSPCGTLPSSKRSMEQQLSHPKQAKGDHDGGMSKEGKGKLFTASRHSPAFQRGGWEDDQEGASLLVDVPGVGSPDTADEWHVQSARLLQKRSASGSSRGKVPKVSPPHCGGESTGMTSAAGEDWVQGPDEGTLGTVDASEAVDYVLESLEAGVGWDDNLEYSWDSISNLGNMNELFGGKISPPDGTRWSSRSPPSPISKGRTNSGQDLAPSSGLGAFRQDLGDIPWLQDFPEMERKVPSGGVSGGKGTQEGPAEQKVLLDGSAMWNGSEGPVAEVVPCEGVEIGTSMPVTSVGEVGGAAEVSTGDWSCVQEPEASRAREDGVPDVAQDGLASVSPGYEEQAATLDEGETVPQRRPQLMSQKPQDPSTLGSSLGEKGARARAARPSFTSMEHSHGQGAMPRSSVTQATTTGSPMNMPNPPPSIHHQHHSPHQLSSPAASGFTTSTSQFVPVPLDGPASDGPTTVATSAAASPTPPPTTVLSTPSQQQRAATPSTPPSAPGGGGSAPPAQQQHSMARHHLQQRHAAQQQMLRARFQQQQHQLELQQKQQQQQLFNAQHQQEMRLSRQQNHQVPTTPPVPAASPPGPGGALCTPRSPSPLLSSASVGTPAAAAAPLYTYPSQHSFKASPSYPVALGQGGHEDMAAAAPVQAQPTAAMMMMPKKSPTEGSPRWADGSPMATGCLVPPSPPLAGLWKPEETSAAVTEYGGGAEIVAQGDGTVMASGSGESTEEDDSVEAKVLWQLETTMKKLDMGTQLCIRDALYRLALGARERRKNSEQSSSGTPGSAMEGESSMAAGGRSNCGGSAGPSSGQANTSSAMGAGAGGSANVSVNPGGGGCSTSEQSAQSTELHSSATADMNAIDRSIVSLLFHLRKPRMYAGGGGGMVQQGMAGPGGFTPVGEAPPSGAVLGMCAPPLPPPPQGQYLLPPPPGPVMGQMGGHPSVMQGAMGPPPPPQMLTTWGWPPGGTPGMGGGAAGMGANMMMSPMGMMPGPPGHHAPMGPPPPPLLVRSKQVHSSFASRGRSGSRKAGGSAGVASAAALGQGGVGPGEGRVPTGHAQADVPKIHGVAHPGGVGGGVASAGVGQGGSSGLQGSSSGSGGGGSKIGSTGGRLGSSRRGNLGSLGMVEKSSSGSASGSNSNNRSNSSGAGSSSAGFGGGAVVGGQAVGQKSGLGRGGQQPAPAVTEAAREVSVSQGVKTGVPEPRGETVAAVVKEEAVEEEGGAADQAPPQSKFVPEKEELERKPTPSSLARTAEQGEAEVKAPH